MNTELGFLFYAAVARDVYQTWQRDTRYCHCTQVMVASKYYTESPPQKKE